MNLNKRDQREILEYLELIREELTDAYHLTDKDGTEEAFCSIDTARDLVDELTYNLENPQEEPVPHEDMDRDCLLYTSPSPRDLSTSRMPSSA